ncbi:hypothetical protein BH23GEM9_BH23GEM9_08520 [soil metagenome]
MRELHHGAAEDEYDDWRVRFRMNALGGRFPMNWAVVACIVREDADVRERRVAVPLRPLDEILAEPREMPAPQVCEACGVATWLAAGVPVCPETACNMSALQARELLSFADDSDAYLANVLDELEDERERQSEAVRRRERGRRRRGRRSEAQEDEFVRLRVMHSGCVWATLKGAETVGEACGLLLDEARRAAREYGDPNNAMQVVDLLDAELSAAADAYDGYDGYDGYDDEFEPEPPPVRDPFAGVGRNDPCPCGSGRKFKKCHGAAGALPADRADHSAGPLAGGPVTFAGGRRPQLVTFDHEPVSFSRAHYRVTDHDRVRAALDACPELEAGSGAGRYVWYRSEPGGSRRLLGNIDVGSPDRLVLESMSRERLDRGKRLLADIAGAWLVHRTDTEQDPWQAVAEAQARPGPREPEVPPEIAGPAIREVMDRHYRTWPDDHLPALGGRTPREAVRDVDSRRAVVELLNTFEAAERRRPEALRYDFDWIREELGLGRIRSF